MTETLERKIDIFQVLKIEKNTIDVYTFETIALYSFEPPKFAGNDNLTFTLDLGEMTLEPFLKKYCLTERYDFSGHDNTVPHLNQDIVEINEDENTKELNLLKVLNSGASNKNPDGYKGLGEPHYLKLFKNDS